MSHMVRSISFICAALILAPATVAADEPAKPTEALVVMTVQPMPAPKPALKYTLLPELKDMNPGNPIHAYLICFMEQQNFFHNKQVVEEREKWQSCPLNELPLERLKDYGGAALRQADYAARLDSPDWGVLLKLRRDGIHLLLPEVQQLRMLAGALKVRFRAEVAARHFDDAIRTAQTMFALARHMGDHPTLIGDLVGIAMEAIATAPLEEMVRQPGCPNLYWALTELPNPLIDLHRGAQGERLFPLELLAQIDEIQPMSAEQLKKVVANIRELLSLVSRQGEPKGQVDVWLDTRANDAGYLAAARKRLAESGILEDTLKQFPPLQVILLDEKRSFLVQRDEVMKVMSLPYWQAEPLVPAEVANNPVPLFDSQSKTLFGHLIPAVFKVKMGQTRVDQRLAMLRCLEAIRIYAAEHGGKLPAALTDIALPLPVDPVTGKPFRYQLEGATAHLRGTPPHGMETVSVYNVHYEIRIQK
jgi:hypothetical protein